MPDFKMPEIKPDLMIPFLVLLIFYLYCLVRWERVKRGLLFLLGAAGLAFAMVGLFFTLGNATIKVYQIFTIIGQIVAFVGAVGACFGGDLPMRLPGEQPAKPSGGAAPGGTTGETPNT